MLRAKTSNTIRLVAALSVVSICGCSPPDDVAPPVSAFDRDEPNASYATASEQKVDALPPHASGIALVEVTGVIAFDERAGDGNQGVNFKIKRVRGSGEFRDTVSVVIDHGGHRAPGDKPKPSAPLKPDSFKTGDRFWIAFASRYDWDHDQGVLAFWPEKGATAAEIEAAIKADAYQWQPQYDPKLKLSVGRLVEKDAWRIRAERNGNVLWEHQLPGTPTDSYTAWALFQSTGGDLAVPMPKCGQILFAESHTALPKDNELGIEPGPYYVNHGYDPETGKLHGTWVRLPQGPSVVLVERAYDPDTGKPTHENRFDHLKTGGMAAGAKTERWYRKVHRTFDASGKVTQEEVFRYNDAESGERWISVTR